MTTDHDPMRAAVDAMREVEAPSTERSAAVRRAVIEAASQRRSAPVPRRARRTSVTTAVLLAAAVGGTAFAAVATQARLLSRDSTPTNSTAPATPPAAVAAPPRALRTRPAPAPAEQPSLTVTAAQPAPRPTSTPAAIVAVAPVTVAPARPTAPRAARTLAAREPSLDSPTSAPRVSPDALYHQAHEAHFVARDPALALSRWDAYLAAAPSGQFVPEAQFNRVVCLVRLGRNREALDALGALPATHYRHAEIERLRAHLEAR
ncbi:MAG: hypothetical protein U0269_29505 [Polyangiales bacterium]